MEARLALQLFSHARSGHGAAASLRMLGWSGLLSHRLAEGIANLELAKGTAIQAHNSWYKSLQRFVYCFEWLFLKNGTICYVLG